MLFSSCLIIDFFFIGVACCEGYEKLYTYQYENTLIFFGTSDYFADANYGKDE